MCTHRAAEHICQKNHFEEKKQAPAANNMVNCGELPANELGFLANLLFGA